MGDEARLAKVEVKVETIAVDVTDMKLSMQKIADALNILSVLEERHNNTAEALNRAFKGIERLSEEVNSIKTSLPTLKLSSSWIFKAVLGLISLETIGILIAVIIFLVRK